MSPSTWAEKPHPETVWTLHLLSKRTSRSGAVSLCGIVRCYDLGWEDAKVHDLCRTCGKRAGILG